MTEKPLYSYPGKVTIAFSYRLQFFANEGPGGEKTEEATTKKLTDARKEGQVARSQELTMSAGLMAFFIVIKIFVAGVGASFIDSFKSSYKLIEIYAKEEFSISTGVNIVNDIGIDILLICMPVLIVGVVVAFIIDLIQVKWQITGKPLQPKFNKINPISGFKKILSKDKIMDLIKSVLKIIMISLIAYNEFKDQVGELYQLYKIGSLNTVIILIGDIVINFGIRVSAVLLLIGFADFFYQKMKFKREMRMSKQEIKDEFKQSEGDPQIKGQIKQKMRAASQRRMMQRLPEADVVITNPTHFACAIKYDKSISEAPILVAKGADYLAGKIKEIAKENKIPIVENKPLARMLYYNVDLEAEIPQELYQMAAEVLAFVYGIKNPQ